MIRNITGKLYWWKVYTKTNDRYLEEGALRYIQGAGRYASGNEGDSVSLGFSFDASRVITTSSENRPVNISAIPLIVAI